MHTEAPFKITVKDDESKMNRELHLTFKDGFAQKELFERTEAFQKYIDQLQHDLSKMAHDNPGRLGVETLLDICENLREDIAKNEVDLNETLVVEIQPSIEITDYIAGGSRIS